MSKGYFDAEGHSVMVNQVQLSFISAIVGGGLTFLGAITAVLYRHRIRRANLESAIESELRIHLQLLEPLVAMRVFYEEGKGAVDYESYETFSEQEFLYMGSPHPFWVLRSLRPKGRTDYDVVYHENLDKVGLFPPYIASAMIEYYSDLGPVYDDLELVSEDAVEIGNWLLENPEEDPDPREINPQIVLDYATTAENALEQNRKLRKQLNRKGGGLLGRLSRL